jgi:23S rRNA (uracil1939-C5)-methyltransferase
MSVNLLLSDHQPVNLIGDLYSRYRVGGRRFRVTAGSFFRPNLGQMDTLIQTVIEALGVRRGQSVLDLYGGVGLFSAFIAPLVERVTLVESYAPAIRDAQANLSDLPNVTIRGDTVETALASLEGHYDAALLDPPGDGLSLDALDRLAALRLPHLVYLSSDPATLARDSKRLAAQGYHLTRVQPLDLAPQTFYIDAVAVLSQ